MHIRCPDELNVFSTFYYWKIHINSKPYSFQRTLITSTSWQAWSTVLNFEILSNSHSKYGGAWFTNIISFDVTGELCGFQARMLLSWFLGWSFLDVCGVKIVEKMQIFFLFCFSSFSFTFNEDGYLDKFSHSLFWVTV